MGSEQSQPPSRQAQRAPPVRRGHTIAVSNLAEASRSSDPMASGNNSPGTSVCSDSELPYISYTVGRPIGDSPKNSSKNSKPTDTKKSILQRRQMSLQARNAKKAQSGIVIVKPATDELLDEDIRRIQEVPTFLPIMRGTIGLPGAKDQEVLEGLDLRPWTRLTSRLQVHLGACAHPIAKDQILLTAKVKETDAAVSKLYSAAVSQQRDNARHAERLARAQPVQQQLARAAALLAQTLRDVEELNALLPEDKRLEPFVWN